MNPIQYEEGVDTGAYLGKKGWIQGHILEEITDLEFENHKDVNKCVLRTLKQAATNVCSMGIGQGPVEKSCVIGSYWIYSY